MSVWRKVGIDLLPEYKGLITRYRINSTTVWYELYEACIEAHQRNSDDLLKRIYAYANWFLHKGNDRLRAAIFNSFISKLPTEESTRRDIFKYFSADDLSTIADPLTWNIGQEEASAIKKQISEAFCAEQGSEGTAPRGRVADPHR